jgi:hypothetical protein
MFTSISGEAQLEHPQEKKKEEKHHQRQLSFATGFTSTVMGLF